MQQRLRARTSSAHIQTHRHAYSKLFIHNIHTCITTYLPNLRQHLRARVGSIHIDTHTYIHTYIYTYVISVS